ncbi:subtilisin-like protein [Mycena crocata]|nr:subtilisin-like protein [Mycena crocata]
MRAHQIFVFLLLRVFASPVLEDLVVHEHVAHLPPEFIDLGPLVGSTVLDLRINLVSTDLAGLEETLNKISAPSSSMYGKWLSKEQVEAYVRPKAATTALVGDWLSQHGIESACNISSSGDWIAFSISVRAANQMLGANFSTYAHTPSGEYYIRTRAYSIPAALRNSHIRLVHPTTLFAGPVISSFFVPTVDSKAMINSTGARACTDMMTPNCLQSLYELPTKAATVGVPNALTVTGFNREYANRADLKSFLEATRPDISPSAGFTEESLDGGVNPQYSPGMEAAVDIQYTVGLATGVAVSFLSVGQNNRDNMNGFLDIVNALRGQEHPPQIITTSYGFASEAAVPENLANSLCDGYMALSARGVSILFSSGDGGVAATQGTQCYGGKFLAAFPSCAHVTIVGGTRGIPEEGAAFSAGGFSNYVPQQDWQSSAVNAYLARLESTYAGRYNRGGRGYPDVAAYGYNIEIIHRGEAKLVGGTSCSSPIFAAVIALLNDDLAAAGKPPLGFLNPWLYENPGAFNDIASGNNPGCGTQGYSATTGWDPITGLGTPNYPRMRAAAGL